MSTSTESTARYWVKNEFGRIWGPFGLQSIGRLDLGTGDLRGRIHISTDGRQFVPIAEQPEVLKAIEVTRANAPPPRRIVETRAETRPEPAPEPAPEATPAPVVAVADAPHAVPATGTLAEHSITALYGLAAAGLQTGRLVVEVAADQGATPGVYALWFKKGTPQRVDVPRAAEELARFLGRRSAAPPAELQRALELCGGPDGDLVDALVALQLVPMQDIFRLLGEHALDLLTRVLGLEAGTFRWEEGPPPAGAFNLGARWTLLCEFMRRRPLLAVKRALGDRVTRAVYRSSGARVKLDQLSLNALETRIAAQFDGTRSPDAIAREMPGEGEIVLRTALLLGDVAYVSFGPVLGEAAAPAVPVFDLDANPALEKVSALEEDVTPVVDGALGKVAVKSVAVRADAKPADAKPADAKPADAKPADAKPADAKPAESKVIAPEPPKASPVVPSAPPPVAAPKPPPVATSRPTPTIVRQPPPPPPTTPAPAPPPPVMTPNARPTTAAANPPPVTPKPAAPVVPRPAAPVAPRPAASAPVAAPAADPELAEARQLAEKWKKFNHFEVLGVGEKATSAEVKHAYFGLARKWHPDTISDPSRADLRQAKADLTARVNEAYGVIGEEQARAKYLHDLKTGAAEQVDIGPILQAEEDFLRATILVKARKYAEAEALLDQAIALNAGEGEFYAWRAFSRFLQTKDKRLAYDEAVADCTKALRMNDRCAAAHLFIGQMSKIVGDHARAEKAFKAVLQLDAKNVEAQRELRLYASQRS